MFFSIPQGACGLRVAVYTVATAIDPEHWDYPSVEQQALRTLCGYIREGRLRAYIMNSNGETAEAQPAQFAGLESETLLSVCVRFGSGGTRSFRASDGRRMMGGELFFY